MEHDHDKCRICSVNRLGCNQVRRELQELLDEGTIEILQNRNVDEDLVATQAVHRTDAAFVVVMLHVAVLTQQTM